ncbi:MAG: CvpA family protein [Patescibacteria group bacterium]|nr:CvpA family protein [Patescibacteria group bacterium]
MVTLSWPDLVMLLVIVGFSAFGFALGLIQVIGSLVGIVAGAWLAVFFYPPLSQALAPYFLGHETAAIAVSFMLVFLLVNRACAFAFYLINKIFHLLSFIPFMKSFNRLGGGLLGLLEGALLLGVILQFSAKLSGLPWVDWVTAKSVVAPWLLRLVELLSPILPAILSAATKTLPIDVGTQII